MKLSQIFAYWKEFDEDSPILAAVVQSVWMAWMLILIGLPLEFKSQIISVIALTVLALIYLSPISQAVKCFLAIIITIMIPVVIVWFVFWSVGEILSIIIKAFNTPRY